MPQDFLSILQVLSHALSVVLGAIANPPYQEFTSLLTGSVSEDTFNFVFLRDIVW